MKKILCVLLSIVMLIPLVACGDTSSQQPEKETTAPVQNTETNTIETTESTQTTENTETIKEPETTPNVEETVQETVDDVPSETLDMVFTYTVYTPNENADGFNKEVIEVSEVGKVNPESVLAELQKRNVLPEDVVVNSCSIDDGFVTIDFNQAFADVVCSMGTSGELMIVGSVVNTFLSALSADSVYFTVDGQILESGHTTYDFVMTFFSLGN